jgi:hypothetical protein
MRRLILFLLLISSLNVYGQIWEPIVESDKKIVYSYDSTSVKRDGDIVTYWELVDYPTPWISGNKTIISSKTKVIQDCKNNRFKISDLMDYDGRKGMGNIVNIELVRKTDWFYGEEGTVNDAMMKLVCGK